jgi:hypothetical protein
VEQQRLLARIAELTGTTRRLATRLERQRAVMAAERAAAAAGLDQARQTATPPAPRGTVSRSRRPLDDRRLASRRRRR